MTGRLFAEADRRARFPFVADGAYLAASAETPLPAAGLAAMHAYQADYARRGLNAFGDTLGVLDGCREALARLLGGVDPGDIALVPNTTIGATAIAHSLHLWPGEEVWTNALEFPSNLWPFEDAAGRAGARVVRLPPDGWATPASLARARLRAGGRAQAICWSWVQYRDGYRVDLGELGAVAGRMDATLAIDAIQGCGAVPLDLRGTPVGALYAGGHKWLMGTGGGGFLYADRRRLPGLRPFGRGWLSVADPMAMDPDAAVLPGARRFEQGNLAWGAFYALKAGVELLLEVGVEAVFAHILALQDRLVSRVEPRGYEVLSVREPAGARGPILALRPPGVAAAELAAALAERDIWVTARDGGLRVAPHLYNTADEIDALADALETAGA